MTQLYNFPFVYGILTHNRSDILYIIEHVSRDSLYRGWPTREAPFGTINDHEGGDRLILVGKGFKATGDEVGCIGVPCTLYRPMDGV